jgi:hypothetical protein
VAAFSGLGGFWDFGGFAALAADVSPRSFFSTAAATGFLTLACVIGAARPCPPFESLRWVAGWSWSCGSAPSAGCALGCV